MRFTRHKEAEEHHDTFEFLMRSYKGGDEYREGKYLKKRELEESSVYEDRLEEAEFDNMCAPVVDIYTSYLMNSKIGRDYGNLSGTIFEEFLADADFEGRSYESFWRVNSRLASIQGVVGILVDKPVSNAKTRADEIASNIRPYFVSYNAESIFDWKFERIGGKVMLTRLVLEEESGIKDVEQFREITMTEWKVWHQAKGTEEPEIIDGGINPLNEIPFVPLRNRDCGERMGGLSDISDIAGLNKRVYNIDSDIDQIRGRAALPFLQVPKSPGSNETVIISLSTVFEFDPDNPQSRASWLEPNLSSIDSSLKQREVVVNGIEKMAKLGGDAIRSAQSGVSLEIKFQQLNALLTEKAEMMQDAELRCLRLFDMWMGGNGETGAVIDYPDSFGVRDMQGDIDTAIKANTLIKSKVFSVEKSMEIVNRYLNDPTQETMDAIRKELEGASTIDLLNVNSDGAAQ